MLVVPYKLNQYEGLIFCVLIWHDLLFPADGSNSGLSSDDLAASVATLRTLGDTCNADVQLLREKPGENGMVAEYLVRNRAEENDFMEIR